MDLADIEDAALDFARRAPAQLVASTVEMLAAELLDTVVGPFGQPLRLHVQPEAPWSLARYTDRLPLTAAKAVRARFDRMLLDAYRSGDAAATGVAYDAFIAGLDRLGAPAAAEHLRVARPHALTFLTHPEAGRLVFGDKGRAELATGVLERVTREMNRRTDVGVRWSLPGARAILMVKLERKYRHGQWAPTPEPITQPPVRFRLVA